MLGTNCRHQHKAQNSSVDSVLCRWVTHRFSGFVHMLNRFLGARVKLGLRGPPPEHHRGSLKSSTILLGSKGTKTYTAHSYTHLLETDATQQSPGYIEPPPKLLFSIEGVLWGGVKSVNDSTLLAWQAIVKLLQKENIQGFIMFKVTDINHKPNTFLTTCKIKS